jgi:hypothetical protein
LESEVLKINWRRQVLIQNKKDFWGGLLLVFLGAGALFMASKYRMGTAFRMGPGYFPVMLSSLLIAVGMILAGMSLKSGEVKLPDFAWRPLIVVSAAVTLFGVIINGAGLVVSTFVMIIVSRFARPLFPTLETIVLGVVISVACAGLFYYGLHIQMPLLPVWWG